MKERFSDEDEISTIHLICVFYFLMLGVKGKNGTIKYTGTFSSEKIDFSFHIVSIFQQGFSKFSMIVFFKKYMFIFEV